MKIALPYENGQVNQHFGRSREFVILEMENRKVVGRKMVSAESLQHNHEGLADLLSRENVDVVILGGIGPYALQALEQSGLKVMTGASGDVEALAEQYARGELVSRKVVCNHQHEHGQGHDHHHHHAHEHSCGGHN
ncbi:MAG: NifB/NifX family molybdenum-iron cluster-binding protein [Bacillota bacterium]